MVLSLVVVEEAVVAVVTKTMMVQVVMNLVAVEAEAEALLTVPEVLSLAKESGEQVVELQA
jgi:hypothetical protein